MSGLKLYVDPLSQVCRSVMMLLATNNIPHELVTVSIREGAQKKNEEFMAVTPMRKVPALCDDGFCLFESSAILRYIVQKYTLPDHWYPSDLQARAKVDEALAWFSGNLRNGLFFNTVMAPKFGLPKNEAKLKELSETMKKALNMVENYFLKDKKFVTGNEISIADLQFVGEITQFWICNCEIEKGYPRMQQWLEDCQEIMGAHFKAACQTVFELRDSGKFKTTLDL